MPRALAPLLATVLLLLSSVAQAAGVSVAAPDTVRSEQDFIVRLTVPASEGRARAVRITWEGRTVQVPLGLPEKKSLPQQVSLTLQGRDTPEGGTRLESLATVVIWKGNRVSAPMLTPVVVDSGAPRTADGQPNACGGADALRFSGRPALPGMRCGACGDGRLVCTDPNTLACMEATPGNACGGCSKLVGTLGERCGGACGGTLACSADGERLECQGATEANACGGCGSLPGKMGWVCGQGGVWACAAPDRLVCVAPGG
jgi:hypothetical protein